jgi:hypothetical protein
MEMKASEVFDRWTILLMKSKYNGDATAELAKYNEETQRLLFDVKLKTPMETWKLLYEAVILGEANAKIWENEAAIRNEFADDPANNGSSLSLEEIGRRALAIRGHNATRVACKKEIDALYGEIPDCKVDHASEEKAKW